MLERDEIKLDRRHRVKQKARTYGCNEATNQRNGENIVEVGRKKSERRRTTVSGQVLTRLSFSLSNFHLVPWLRICISRESNEGEVEGIDL